LSLEGENICGNSQQGKLGTFIPVGVKIEGRVM